MFGLVISNLIKFILSFAYLGQLSMKWSMVFGQLQSIQFGEFAKWSVYKFPFSLLLPFLSWHKMILSFLVPGAK